MTHSSMATQFVSHVLARGIILLVIASHGLEANELEKRWWKFAQQLQLEQGPAFAEALREGQTRFARDEYEAAAQAFGRASLESPYHPLPNFYLALSLFALREYTLSGKQLRLTVGLYPEWKIEELQIPGFFVNPAFFQTHYAHLETWLAETARPSDAYFLFAFLSHFSQHPDKAIATYNFLLRKEPWYTEAQRFLWELAGKEDKPAGIEEGQRLFAQKDYERAAHLWGQAFLAQPWRSELLYYQTAALLGARAHSHAAAVLTHAMGLAPDLLTQLQVCKAGIPESPLWPEVLLLQVGQSPSADELFLSGYSCWLLGESDKARLPLNELVKKRPDHRGARILLWQLGQQTPEKNPASSTPAEKTPEPQPEKTPTPAEKTPDPQPENLLANGQAMFKAGQYTEAARLFSQALEKNPSSAEIRNFLILAMFAVGSYEYAHRFTKQWLISVARDEIRLNWREAYSKPEIFDQHLSALETWTAKHPTDHKARFLQAVVLFGLARFEDATRAFTQLSSTLSDDPDVLYYYTLLKLQGFGK